MQLQQQIRRVILGGFIFLLAGIFCSFVTTEKQEVANPDETTLKALFIYNFTKHIEWPVSAMGGSRFTIGFYGANEVRESTIRVTKGRTVFDKQFEVKNITGTDQITGLHILYVGKVQSSQLEKILQLYGDKGILIITEEKGMVAKGAGINMIRKGENLRFELNEVALRKSGLKVSSQLISLAISNR